MTIAPPAGIAANDVGYGVVLNGVAPPKGERMSIEAITAPLVQDWEQKEAMKPSGDRQPDTVSAVQGRSVTLHSISPPSSAKGQTPHERDWLVTVRSLMAPSSSSSSWPRL